MKKVTAKKVLTLIVSLILILTMVTGCGGGTKESASVGTTGGAPSGTPSSTPAEKPASPAAPAPSDGKVYEIVFNTADLETTCNSQIVLEWQKVITKETNNRIQFVNYWSGALASSPELLDATKSGVIDMCFAITSIYPGTIVATNILCAPGLGLTFDENGAMASWEVITTHPQIYKEYDGFKLLGCSTNGAFTVINNKRPILKPEDFKGLRIRINNVMTKGMMEALGAVPLSFNVTDTYENIEKNIADGILMDWDYFYKNRFYEICPYAMDMGLCSTTTVILMNPDTFNKLPDDLKAVMDKYSGEYLVRLGGQMKEKANKEAIEGMKSKGAQLSPVSKELEEAMQKAEEAGFKAFIEEANKKGFDGQQIVDFAREVVAKWCKK